MSESPSLLLPGRTVQHVAGDVETLKYKVTCDANGTREEQIGTQLQVFCLFIQCSWARSGKEAEILSCGLSFVPLDHFTIPTND